MSTAKSKESYADADEGQTDSPARRGGHVALYMQSFTGGGAERVMVNLALGLAARGLRVDLVVARAEGPYLSLVTPDIRLIDLQCQRSLTSLPGLVRYLGRERPDALLSALGQSNLIALAAAAVARFQGRVVISIHTHLSGHYRHAAGAKNQIFLHLCRRFYRRADAIVAVSHEAATDLKQAFGLPPDRVRMIYNPVVSPALFLSAKEPVEHPWFIQGQPPVVLAVGRLCEQKDFLTLLRAFAQVRSCLPARLLILGEGPSRSQLEAAVSELGLSDSVALPGFVANPYSYMARAAVYALSSRWEGLPTVLIEALACGVPVISTDCPSGPREILRDGHYGSLVPVGDVNALARSLEEVLRGGGLPAPKESWAAFETVRAVANYERVLLGAGGAPEKT